MRKISKLEIILVVIIIILITIMIAFCIYNIIQTYKFSKEDINGYWEHENLNLIIYDKYFIYRMKNSDSDLIISGKIHSYPIFPKTLFLRSNESILKNKILYIKDSYTMYLLQGNNFVLFKKIELE